MLFLCISKERANIKIMITKAIVVSPHLYAEQLDIGDIFETNNDYKTGEFYIVIGKTEIDGCVFSINAVNLHNGCVSDFPAKSSVYYYLEGDLYFQNKPKTKELN